MPPSLDDAEDMTHSKSQCPNPVSLWSNKIPNLQKIDSIRQITYFVPDDSSEDELFEIWALNNFTKQDESNPYIWATMPLRYINHIRSAVYRLELLKIAAYQDRGDTFNSGYTKIYLAHMDRTLDMVWKEAQEAEIKNEMSAEWVAPALNMWLRVEYFVRRHAAHEIEAFLAGKEQGIFEQDVFKLGEHLYNFLSHTHLINI